MIKRMVQRYKSVILYIFFGGCTTLVNVLTYAVFTRVFRGSTMTGSVAAWVFAVAFAFVTNKRWVFESRVTDSRGILREICAFVICRMATGCLDLGVMYLTVEVLHFNDLLMKLLSNLMVIMLNFVFSKRIIFKKGLKKQENGRK